MQCPEEKLFRPLSVHWAEQIDLNPEPKTGNLEGKIGTSKINERKSNKF